MGMKTLIVDDDNIMRRILKRTAMSLGHEVTGCVDAEKAMEAFQAEAFSLVILDWMLPGMDGLELCKKIRQMPHGDRVVILMVTAKNTYEDLLEVLNAGADDYIAKPVDVKILKTRLTVAERVYHNIVKRKDAEDERTRLISELQEALEKVKTLKGARAHCPFCNRVHSEGDVWVDMEKYLKAHMDVFFTSGICPVCMTTHKKEIERGEHPEGE